MVFTFTAWCKQNCLCRLLKKLAFEGTDVCEEEIEASGSSRCCCYKWRVLKEQFLIAQTWLCTTRSGSPALTSRLRAPVRSFGTEDRPTDRPAPPREEIYEYIIFRGSDIKDITVCEPPKAQHTLPQDPAIVQVSQPQVLIKSWDKTVEGLHFGKNLEKWRQVSVSRNLQII